MKNLRNLIAVSVIAISLAGQLGFGKDQGLVPLNGKALITFDDAHHFIETEKYFYKISKIGLERKLSKRIELAALNGQKISIAMPTKQIKYVWPVANIKSNLQVEAKFEAPPKDSRNLKKEKPGFTQIEGKMVLSFNEPYYLIQMGESIYQIIKSDLNKQQQDEIARVSIGSEISFSVPTKAINMTWVFRPVQEREIASSEGESDLTEKNRTYTSIRGTVLYSANQSSVIVQSHNLVYQLNRGGISTQDPKALDLVGAKVQLVVPNDKIEFLWETTE